jgi:predicted transcriptional regulator YheO
MNPINPYFPNTNTVNPHDEQEDQKLQDLIDIALSDSKDFYLSDEDETFDFLFGEDWHKVNSFDLDTPKYSKNSHLITEIENSGPLKTQENIETHRKKWFDWLHEQGGLGNKEAFKTTCQFLELKENTVITYYNGLFQKNYNKSNENLENKTTQNQNITSSSVFRNEPKKRTADIQVSSKRQFKTEVRQGLKEEILAHPPLKFLDELNNINLHDSSKSKKEIQNEVFRWLDKNGGKTNPNAIELAHKKLEIKKDTLLLYYQQFPPAIFHVQVKYFFRKLFGLYF